MTPPKGHVLQRISRQHRAMNVEPVNHRTLTHTSGTKFDFHILYSKKLKIAHVEHRKNIKYCDIKAPECGREINPEHVTSSIRTLTCSTLWTWWGPTGRICSGLRTCWVSKFCDDFVIFVLKKPSSLPAIQGRWNKRKGWDEVSWKWLLVLTPCHQWQLFIRSEENKCKQLLFEFFFQTLPHYCRFIIRAACIITQHKHYS